MDNRNDLYLLLRSRHPLLVAPTDDEDRVLRLIGEACRRDRIPIWTWWATTASPDVARIPPTTRPA